MKFFASLSALFLLTSCAHLSSSGISKVTHLTMKTPAPIVGRTVSGQDIYLGGFSGLSFIEEKEGALYFNAITDRGPTGWSNGIDRPFLLPEYSPRIVTLKADLQKNTLEVVEQLPLKKKDGRPLTGLPNQRTEENPTDLYGFMYSIDPMGLDTEAIVRDGEGGYWVGEGYAPSLAHFDSKGMMTRRLTPVNELPKIYHERRPNRGFEGIALLNNKLYGFLQSPLAIEDTSSRIVEIDLDSMRTSAEYFYPFEKGNDKIGDAVAFEKNTMLVIEQNGKAGKESSKLIYKITLNGGDQPVQKTLIADLKDTPFNNVEKVEGLALINSHQLALVYDNDFQISERTDPKTGLTPLNQQTNQMLILDFKENIK